MFFFIRFIVLLVTLSLFSCNKDKLKYSSTDENHINSISEKPFLLDTRCENIQWDNLEEVDNIFSNLEAIPSSVAESIIRSALLKSQIRIAVKYSRKLFKNGCSKKFFKKLGRNYAVKDSDWNDFIESIDSVKISINHEAKEDFHDLYYRDQLISSTFINANINPLYRPIKTQFYELIQKYGFPSDELIGKSMKNDTTIGVPIYYVIMLHHYHKGEPLLWNELDSLVNNGYISCNYYEEYKQLEPNASIAEKMNARRSSYPKRKVQPIRVFTDNTKPVCEETYLYVSEERNQVEVLYSQEIRLAYLDWNSDGLFREKNVDYFAFVYPDETLSCYFKIGNMDTITLNGSPIVIDHLTMESQMLNVSRRELDIDMNFFTQFDNVPLVNDASFSLVDLVHGTTIIYFYSTWCKPCIEKMTTINASSCEFKVNFIPVALESSENSIQLLFERFNLSFPMLIGSEELKYQYDVQSFPFVMLLNEENHIVERKTILDLSDIFVENSCG